jgi:hypothetical protein
MMKRTPGTSPESRFQIAVGILLVVVLIVAVPCIAGLLSRPQQATSHSVGLFERDPNGVWNRVHRCLLVRTSADSKEYGDETLDPLLWRETKHLLTGDSHRLALNCLDEFLRTHAEQQVRDPVRRAIFLRDLWAVFDWSARDGGNYELERRELQVRLAEVLRRVAPAAAELAALPDNYEAAIKAKAFAADYDPANPHTPFLPPDLFDPHGAWVCFTLRGYGPVASQHVGAFGARSRFLVFMRLPGGRAATLAYLRTLWGFPEPLAINGFANRKVPQFPAGTMFAFARQMNLFDASGKLVSTPVTESLQIRVYHRVTTGPGAENAHNGPSSGDQDSFEFRFARRALVAGRLGLVEIGREETEFRVFGAQGRDEFEASSSHPQVEILQSCSGGCHGGSGIHSVQSREPLVRMREHGAADVLDDAHFGPVYWETEEALGAKQGRYDWGLLNGYWKAKQP